MADPKKTDARTVLEKIRAENHPSLISAETLGAVYALEHEKQYEIDREPVKVQLRDLINDAVGKATQ